MIKIKILVVSDMTLPYLGGNETYVYNLGKQLIKKGNRFGWLGCKIGDVKNFEMYEGLNIYRANVPFSRKYMTARKFFPITSLYALLKIGKRFDIIQFNSFIGAVNGWVVGKLLGKPYLAMVHELFGELWNNLNVNKLEKIIYPTIERYIAKSPYPFFICPSKYTKNTLIKMGVEPDIIKVIYHGIDHELFHQGYKRKFRKKWKIEDKHVIGWTGRLELHVSKNLSDLLEAFKIIKKELKDVVLLLGGSGFENFAPNIKKYGLKIGKDVIYNGRLPKEDLPYFYSSVDCYLLPSLSEGLGFAALEAMACGAVPVVYKVGALPEIVSDGKTGFVVDEIKPESLAEAAIKLITNKKKRNKIRKNCKRWVKNFTWEKSAKEHLKIYKKVTRQKS